MATAIDLSVRLIPWDDAAFVRAFEVARYHVRTEGLTVNGPESCARVEALIREAGFPRARVDCERTASEAMTHSAHWTVRRDGTGP